MCPKCNVELSEHYLSNTIEPFWKQLSSLFKYPLQRTPLTLIGLLTLGLLLCEILIDAEVLFIMVPILAYIAATPFVLLYYCNTVFNRTAKGDFNTAPHWHEVTGSKSQLLLQFCLLLFLFFPEMIFEYDTDNGLLNVALLIIVFMQPAIIMIMVASKSVVKAINPIVIVTLIYRIGWPYCMLAVFISLLFSAPLVLISKLPYFGLLLVLLNAVWQYYMIVIYHLLGYVVFQYQEELGFRVGYSDYLQKPDNDKFSTLPVSHQIQYRLLAEVNILIKETKLSEALELIRVNTKGEIHNVDLGLRYISLMERCGKQKAIPRVGRNVLDLLLQENRRADGMDVYKKCRKEDDTFSPREEVLRWLLDCFERSGDLVWVESVGGWLRNGH